MKQYLKYGLIFIIIVILLLGAFIVTNSIMEKEQAKNEIPYGNSTVSQSGGLLLCMNKASELIGLNSNPSIEEYANLSVSNGYKLNDFGTDYKFIEFFYSKYDINVESISRIDKESLKNALEENCPVIMLCGNGNFTSTGKYILLYNMIDTKNISVFDPYSEEISNMTFSLNYLINNSSRALEDQTSYWKISTNRTLVNEINEINE